MQTSRSTNFEKTSGRIHETSNWKKATSDTVDNRKKGNLNRQQRDLKRNWEEKL